MNEANERDVLQVKMFGKFSMTWDGIPLTGESKSSESQFICLMEMLLHMRDTGVTRDQLEHTLFEDRDIDDVHHALRSVLYNARKKLKSCGLPEADYIVSEKGVFTWTKDIPVAEDAYEMEMLIREAEQETDPARKKELYLDACYKYTGEFLANQIGTVWIAKEARKYREMFFDCMDKTTAILRETQEQCGLGLRGTKTLIL